MSVHFPFLNSRHNCINLNIHLISIFQSSSFSFYLTQQCILILSCRAVYFTSIFKSISFIFQSNSFSFYFPEQCFCFYLPDQFILFLASKAVNFSFIFQNTSSGFYLPEQFLLLLSFRSIHFYFIVVYYYCDSSTYG